MLTGDEFVAAKARILTAERRAGSVALRRGVFKMRSIGSWRISTWLIVLWSGFCGFTAVSLILGMATACVGKTDTVTPTCQDWATALFGAILLPTRGNRPGEKIGRESPPIWFCA